MKPVRDFIIQAEGGETPRARLFYQGSLVGSVYGSVLEAQYQFRGGYLVVTRDGLVAGESLHFALLDTQRRPMDFASLGPGQGGSVRDLRAAGPESLSFQFGGSERWQLTVMEVPRRVTDDVPMVRYPGAGAMARHRLKLEATASAGAL